MQWETREKRIRTRERNRRQKNRARRQKGGWINNQRRRFERGHRSQEYGTSIFILESDEDRNHDIQKGIMVS
jgi:hypothetical protein